MDRTSRSLEGARHDQPRHPRLVDGRPPAHHPGILAAGQGRLAFVTGEGPLFAVPLSEIAEVRWPWHWFGGGCRFAVSGHEYAMTVVRPNGAPPVPPSLPEGLTRARPHTP